MNKEKYIKNIPQELKERNQWLWFKIYHNKDKNGNTKLVKIPISPLTCESNEWNKKDNWSDFETALDGLEKVVVTVYRLFYLKMILLFVSTWIK